MGILGSLGIHPVGYAAVFVGSTVVLDTVSPVRHYRDVARNISNFRNDSVQTRGIVSIFVYFAAFQLETENRTELGDNDVFGSDCTLKTEFLGPFAGFIDHILFWIFSYMLAQLFWSVLQLPDLGLNTYV